MKKFKNVKRIFCMLILFIFVVLLSGCNNPTEKEYKDPSTFDAYLNELLIYLIDEDASTINSFFIHPENYGMEIPDGKLPYEEEELTEEEYLEDYNEMMDMLRNCENYKYEDLTFDQQLCYETIKMLIKYYSTELENINYYESDYFGSYMGTNVDFPVLLSSYNFRVKKDVDNYLAYIESAPKAFNYYLDCEFERTEAGFGFINSIIYDIIDHAEQMIENSDSSNGNHFLVESFNNMIDAVDFLTTEEKEEYKEKNKVAIAGPFTEAYQAIIDRMPQLLNKATNEQGLYYYTNENGDRLGQQYYQMLLNYVTGYDYTLKEYVDYIEKQLSTSYSNLQNVYQQLSKNQVYFNSLFDYEFPEMSVEEQVDYFKEASAGLYPEITTDYTLKINYVDEAVEDHYSPAFYILSPVDGAEIENVFLNRKNIYKEVEDPETGETTLKLDSTYLFSTLAHESYPGHMYQRLYMKQQGAHPFRLIVRCLGTVESWSTYSETIVYDLYFADTTKYPEGTADFFILNNSFSNAVYARMELGIHYQGWTLDRTYQFMKRYYDVTKSDVRDVYRQLVELPGNAMAYNFAYFKILEMRDYALEHGASLYDFHKMYLDCGNVPQQFIENYIHAQYE